MSWTHLGDEKPVARKVYRCYLCDREIPVGEKHIKRTGSTEDGLWSGRMHADCEALTQGWSEHDWECHDPAAFREDVLELEEE